MLIFTGLVIKDTEISFCNLHVDISTVNIKQDSIKLKNFISFLFIMFASYLKDYDSACVFKFCDKVRHRFAFSISFSFKYISDSLMYTEVSSLKLFFVFNISAILK